MQLTFKNPEGVVFAYDPQSNQWTAQQAGEKNTSSKDLSALQQRLFNRDVAKRKDPAKQGVKTTIATGLAGIRKVHNHLEDAAWSLQVGAVDSKLEWDSKTGAPTVVRYRTTKEGSNWESAHNPLVLLDPEVFEPADIERFKAMIRRREVKQHVVEGERLLAQAWVAPVPVVSQLMKLEGAQERFNPAGVCTDAGKAITWQPTTHDQSSSRNKVVLGEHWPVLTSPTAAELTDAELAEWTDEGPQGWRHATGVRLRITQLTDLYADFAVSRPTPSGDQEVSSGHDFVEQFRLAQATAQVVQANHAPVEEWRATAQWEQANDPYWPTRTFTEACFMAFMPKAVRDTGVYSEKCVYLLQRVERDPGRPQYGQEKSEHAVWTRPSVTERQAYRPASPDDARTLDARDALRHQGAQIMEPVQELLRTFAQRMDELNAATVAHAYQEGCDGTTRTAGEATQRLTLFFERLTQNVRAEPALKALEAHVERLRSGAPAPAASDEDTPSTVTPGRRQAAPVRRRPR